MRLAIGFLLASLLAVAQRTDPLEFFEMKVRPVLAKNCFGCHTQTKLGGLEMSSRETLVKGGKSGPAIDTERPAQSLMIQAVRQTHARLKMPPTGKLSNAEIDDMEAWIGRGAVWPASSAPVSTQYRITDQQRAWWAFQPVKRIAPPPVKDRTWARTPVDQFILSAIEAKGLKPVREASRHDWIRRLSFDLTGLPPKAEDVEAFLADKSPQAREKVVDRLLASKHFGERWGRHWLDLARYSDDRLNSTQDEPYDNAYRYRDWVIEAFNSDMPYDQFMKAQIAGDMIDAKEKHVAGLGFYALSPQFQDDRVEVTGKAFLGLTVACAQCHDHKFDPIPTKDYYSMLGVFTSTDIGEYPLASQDVVKLYKERKDAHERAQAKLNKYLEDQAKQLAEILANRTVDYVRAARGGVAMPDLDAPTLERWTNYLKMPEHEHPFAKLPPEELQSKVLEVLKEQREVEEKNFIRLGGSSVRNDLARADLLSLPRDKYLLWRDILSPNKFAKFDSGILYYKKIDRFLSGEWKSYLDRLRAEVDTAKQAIPDRYPYYHVISDKAKPRTERIRIRGSADNLGEEAPRRFLAILNHGEQKPFTNGSGRLELAEAIADTSNPLPSRVIANRVWHHLFGQGIVRTLSNYGRLGEMPSHPELLDYLAGRLLEQKWSLKALIREVVLTNTYALGYENETKAFTADPENRLNWRANRRRLDIESMRDSLLAASGELDASMGGKPLKIADEKNLRRTVYSFVSRRKLDGTLALFDFPNPNSTSEQRIFTATPTQQLFFLNSSFVQARSQALATALEKAGPDDAARIRQAYRILFFREPDKTELSAGLAYLKSDSKSWPRYAQVLLSANEFVFY